MNKPVTKSIDAATIRELLAQCEAGVMLSAQTGALLARYALELSDKVQVSHDNAERFERMYDASQAENQRLRGELETAVEMRRGAEYNEGLTLADAESLRAQLQSQAAELERLREWKCRFCSCQFSVSYASGSIYCPSCMTLAGVAETFSIPMPIKEQP